MKNPLKGLMKGKFFQFGQKTVPAPTTPQKDEAEAAKEIQQWLDNPENRARIVETAKVFDQIMKAQWFELKDVMNRTNYRSVNSALNILHTLKLAGCLVAEERATKEVFRIVLTGSNKIKLLEAIEKRTLRKLEEIKTELKELRAKK